LNARQAAYRIARDYEARHYRRKRKRRFQEGGADEHLPDVDVDTLPPKDQPAGKYIDPEDIGLAQPIPPPQRPLGHFEPEESIEPIARRTPSGVTFEAPSIPYPDVQGLPQVAPQPDYWSAAPPGQGFGGGSPRQQITQRPPTVMGSPANLPPPGTGSFTAPPSYGPTYIYIPPV
jgi:hypothetical protein